jgi:hypothetical protein
MMMILVVMKILTVITRGGDDSDGKAVMIRNDYALVMRIRRNVLMIIFMLIATMSNKNQPLPAHRAD